ncbi:MAG: hypothetical protein IT196_18110 [Acidimicrobiales bacterium]|nr:hypothetical protein [Acidimicrobiales bacterium]
MGWADSVEDVSLELRCSGATHRLSWSAGRVRAPAHPDLAGEEALAALGGELPACVAAVQLWRIAVADGGFLSDWSDTDLDDPVYRHHLRISVNRLRAEGVQDFLRGLPPRRAEAMGHFLLQFPQRWVDRAALSVVRAGRSGRHDERTAAAVRRAVQVRARSAFVHSLTRWASVVRPAALVRFDCRVVGWHDAPAAAGMLDGTASWCRVALSPAWLLEVWGQGRAINPDGDLVLGGGELLVWRPGPDGRPVATVQSP